MKVETIDLETFRAKGSKVFTGRDRGKSARLKSKIDSLEKDSDQIIIIIPDNIYSIIPSFFEELFVNVVRKLGREAFLRKFRFNSLGAYKYERPLYEAIDRILREETALG